MKRPMFVLLGFNPLFFLVQFSSSQSTPTRVHKTNGWAFFVGKKRKSDRQK